MAAVTTSPRRQSSSNGTIRRKPIPLHDLSPDQCDWEDSGKTLPSVPLGGSPRLRQPPLSPVKVEFHPEHWPQPSNVSIETDDFLPSVMAPSIPERPLPKTPQAPTPPPHTPVIAQPQQQALPGWGGSIRTTPKGRDNALPTPEPRSLEPSLRDSIASPEPEDASISGESKAQEVHRHSRDTDTTTSTGQQQASAESSATTSASSISGVNEAPDSQENASPESSIIEEPNQPVPQLQYHHQAFLPRASSISALQEARTQSNPDLTEHPASINRHLTPNSHLGGRTSLPRPRSAYSVYSDIGPRGRSPGFYGGSHVRAPSAHSRRSPDIRPSSYAELLNVPYPQPAPAPITLDNSQLRNVVGTNASLLSTQKTLEMYRLNVKKTNDVSIQYSFAVFLIATAQEQGLNFDDHRKRSSPAKGRQSPLVENSGSSPLDLVREARTILQKLSSNGYPFAQYYLADGYASGLFSKGKEDYNAAFPLFVLAAKHGHAESAYRAALCYEFGWGCRKDPAKAVLFLRTAASKRHPGAMTRLGKACLSGDLGEKRYREGIKWLKLAAESADAIYNAAPYHLGCLYETGYGDDIFQDESYAAELFTQAADLGHAEANYRMGDAYEHGRLNCPHDPALSVHFYTGAAERGHAGAMMGLCAWYMVGAEPLLEKDEEEAYEWAHRSAELGTLSLFGEQFFCESGA